MRGNSHRLCIWNWHFYRNSRILLALDGSTCRFRAFKKRPLLNTFGTVIPCLYWLLQRCIWQYSPLWWCPKESDLTFVAVIEVFSFPLVSWRRLPFRPSEPYCQGLHLSSRLYQRLYSLMYPMYPLQLQLLLEPPNLQWNYLKVGTFIYFETDVMLQSFMKLTTIQPNCLEFCNWFFSGKLSSKIDISIYIDIFVVIIFEQQNSTHYNDFICKKIPVSS